MPGEPAKDVARNDHIEVSQDGKATYRIIIGSLVYRAIKTRLDIALSASVLDQFVEKETQHHMNAAFKVLWYLRGTSSYKFHSSPEDTTQLNVHTNATWGSDISPYRKSRTGLVITYGNAPLFLDKAIAKEVSLSTSRAEHMALSDAAKNVIWLRHVLAELGMHQESTVIYHDNSGTIDWANGGPARNYLRRKHIDIRHHFLTLVIQEGHIRLIKVPTELMSADFLTKLLPSQSLFDALTRLHLFLPVQRNN